MQIITFCEALIDESNGLLHRAMEAVRRAAERIDCYGGVMLLHSLSGGTGSGK